MPIIIVVVIIAGAVYVWSMFRAKLFIQASTFLMYMSRPDVTPEIANGIALSIDLFAAKELAPGARHHCQELFNGQQLALISEARLRGFRG